ncbi:MAG TPA: tetratricopeptide repeat protein [Gemmatimonadales bacterium]|jgi:tetratricopeptide (TPR) repeat protein|nr:tetratricopeptide repeat protein [Gemmatimonadales bacterium]
MHENAELPLERARARFALGDYHGAVVLADELIAGGRAYADAYQLRGLALALLGQPDRALESFDAALALNPRYVEALVHRGLVLGDLGRTDEAAEHFRRAAEADAPAAGGLPKQAVGRLANLHAELADAYVEAGAYTPAVKQYRAALALGPEFYDLRFRFARVLLRAGRHLEAREELERVLAARPSLLEAEVALGLAKYLSGDADGAQEAWLACRGKRPEDPRLDAYLAMTERVPQ